MKKIQNNLQMRSVRRLIKQWFSSIKKRQRDPVVEGMELMLRKLLEIEDSIEVMATDMERQSRATEKANGRNRPR